ncbi:hypothetical protein KC19_VG294600 [Ceratodon purpureus]|uniref:Uncharacterized protein n=1 Tax=Ceratodon purpureus TaxID=3225 RepID=A0A8T0HVV3_CERPU|nr:hypothetical protein KC19_VG294600 [Ceratodon purpureus]
MNHHEQDKNYPEYNGGKGGKRKMYPMLGKPLSAQAIMQGVWERLNIKAPKPTEEPPADETNVEDDEEEEEREEDENLNEEEDGVDSNGDNKSGFLENFELESYDEDYSEGESDPNTSIAGTSGLHSEAIEISMDDEVFVAEDEDLVFLSSDTKQPKAKRRKVEKRDPIDETLVSRRCPARQATPIQSATTKGKDAQRQEAAKQTIAKVNESAGTGKRRKGVGNGKGKEATPVERGVEGGSKGKGKGGHTKGEGYPS